MKCYRWNIERVFSSEEVQFAVVHGDITSNYSTTKENVVSKVGALIETIKVSTDIIGEIL